VCTRLLVLLLALLAGGCASTVDRIVTRVGGPERGFLTPAALAGGSAASDGCTAAGCFQAPAFCAARGYLRGSDAYNRCIVSVELSLRRR